VSTEKWVPIGYLYSGYVRYPSYNHMIIGDYHVSMRGSLPEKKSVTAALCLAVSCCVPLYLCAAFRSGMLYAPAWDWMPLVPMGCLHSPEKKGPALSVREKMSGALYHATTAEEYATSACSGQGDVMPQLRAFQSFPSLRLHLSVLAALPALPRHAKSCCTSIRIALVKRMPPLTMRLLCIDPTPHVLPMGDGFKMSRVHASRRTAQVVQFQLNGNVGNIDTIGKTMGTVPSPSHGEHSISLGGMDRSSPEPTPAIRQDDLAQKTQQISPGNAETQLSARGIYRRYAKIGGSHGVCTSYADGCGQRRSWCYQHQGGAFMLNNIALSTHKGNSNLWKGGALCHA
jgi:hypothetical protein